MRIIVTGGCGFIGSNLVRHLIAACGHTVLNLDVLTYAGNRASLEDIEGNDRYEFQRVDIRDSDELSRTFSAFSPEAVMHLAAESHVDRSIDGPAEFLSTNVNGTFALLEASLQYWRSVPGLTASGFRFIHVSTDEVYGSLDADDAPFTEFSRYDPHSPYAASKAASDHLARAWHDTYGLPVIVTNCSNNFGPYQFPEKLIPVVILKCLSGEAIPVYGTGDNVRDWLFVLDHVEALARALHEGRSGTTYNIGGSNELTNLELVRKVCAVLDGQRPRADGRPHAASIEFVEDRPGHDKRYAIDSSKAREELGWHPRHSLDEALEETVAWYLSNEAWWRRILERGHDLTRLGTGRVVRESGR